MVGLGLATVGLSALVGMWEVNVPQAREVEDAMAAQKRAILEIQEQPAEKPVAASQPSS